VRFSVLLQLRASRAMRASRTRSRSAAAAFAISALALVRTVRAPVVLCRRRDSVARRLALA
jgi:hypothetical protein